MAEGDVMASTIEDKLDNLSRLTERVLVKLFGEVEGETPNGRLPTLERIQTDHEDRIRGLEKTALRIGAMLTVILGLVGLAEAVAHVATAVRH